MLTKNELLQRVKDYRGDHEINHESQSRLKNLVQDFGIEFVGIASGMTVSTLTQYLRVKTAPSINLKSVIKAEKILKGE